jgi:hypothetical protein
MANWTSIGKNCFVSVPHLQRTSDSKVAPLRRRIVASSSFHVPFLLHCTFFYVLSRPESEHRTKKAPHAHLSCQYVSGLFFSVSLFLKTQVTRIFNLLFSFDLAFFSLHSFLELFPFNSVFSLLSIHLRL